MGRFEKVPEQLWRRQTLDCLLELQELVAQILGRRMGVSTFSGAQVQRDPGSISLGFNFEREKNHG